MPGLEYLHMESGMQLQLASRALNVYPEMFWVHFIIFVYLDFIHIHDSAIFVTA